MKELNFDRKPISSAWRMRRTNKPLSQPGPTMTHIKLGILGVGVLFTIIGGCYLYAQWNVVQEPVPVDLAALERGEKAPSRYIRVEQYVARAGDGFVRALVGDDGSVQSELFFFYPIVSPENPAADLEAPLEQFAVLVRRGGVPTDLEGNPQVGTGPLEGTVGIGFDALEGDEVTLVRQEYPAADTSNIIVLIPGQKPWITMGSWIWLVFGVVVTLVGAASLLQRGDD